MVVLMAGLLMLVTLLVGVGGSKALTPAAAIGPTASSGNIYGTPKVCPATRGTIVKTLGVTQNYSPNQCVTPPLGIVNWWTFDEPSGATAQDIRGFANNVGTHVNGPTPVAGMVGGALSFDGVNDYVEVNNHPEINFLGSCSGPTPFAEPMTIDLWVRTNIAPGTGPSSGLMTILDKRVKLPGDVYHGYHLILFNGRLGFQIEGLNYVAPSSGPNYIDVANNQWHFVAVSLRMCSGGGGFLYVDGNTVLSIPPAPGFDNTAKLYFGSRDPAIDGPNFFTGALDEMEMFKRALSTDELRVIFEAGSAGKCKFQCSSCRHLSDFDGDGKDDVAVFRPAEANWYSINSSTNTVALQNWGLPTDKIVPGDYDGDGKTDYAVWRAGPPSDWYIIYSSGQATFPNPYGLGQLGDILVPADYDGDGKQDLAVWQPSPAPPVWRIRLSSGSTLTVSPPSPAGNSQDIPVPRDYDGDCRADLAVWRPSTGDWLIFDNAGNVISMQHLTVAHQGGDIPVPADYDGDGRADLAVFRPSNGTWYIRQSSNGQEISRQWGTVGDIPVPACYDGDGKTDIAVYRPSEGNWYILQSSTGTVRIVNWGTASDIPVPAAYNP
jgi:hypothetical protein